MAPKIPRARTPSRRPWSPPGPGGRVRVSSPCSAGATILTDSASSRRSAATRSSAGASTATKKSTTRRRRRTSSAPPRRVSRRRPTWCAARCPGTTALPVAWSSWPTATASIISKPSCGGWPGWTMASPTPCSPFRGPSAAATTGVRRSPRGGWICACSDCRQRDRPGTRQPAVEHRLAQQIDGPVAGKAAAPSETDTPRRRRLDEGPYPQQRVVLGDILDGRGWHDGDADAAGHHVAYGFKGTTLEQMQVARAGIAGPGAKVEHLVAKAVARTEHQERFGEQPWRLDGLLPPPRVSGRNEGAKRLVIDRLGDDARLGDRQGDDDDVQLAALEQVEEGGGIVLGDVERHLRCPLAQQRHQRRQQVRSDGVDAAEAERPRQRIAALGGQFADPCRLGEDALGLGHDLRADRGQPDFAGAAFEQDHAEFRFELFHGHRQGRLGDEALFGGAAEMALASQGRDVAQVGERHWPAPP